jgi:hypothetical protein
LWADVFLLVVPDVWTPVRARTRANCGKPVATACELGVARLNQNFWGYEDVVEAAHRYGLALARLRIP